MNTALGLLTLLSWFVFVLGPATDQALVPTLGVLAAMVAEEPMQMVWAVPASALVGSVQGGVQV